MTVAAPAAAAATVAKTGTTAISSLAGNFTDFLKLLMTQLQNQNPASPMDTNQFTSQLVQFAGVEQQINTNSSLTKLIDATQGSTLLQGGTLVGQTVEVSGSELSLQSGAGRLRLVSAAPGTATVGIYSAAGVKLREAVVPVGAGSTDWSWDGKDSGGLQRPDGAYKVVVKDASGADLAFTSLGTVTGVRRANGAMKVSLGGMQVDMASVQSVGAR